MMLTVACGEGATHKAMACGVRTPTSYRGLTPPGEPYATHMGVGETCPAPPCVRSTVTAHTHGTRMGVGETRAAPTCVRCSVSNPPSHMGCMWGLCRGRDIYPRRCGHVGRGFQP